MDYNIIYRVGELYDKEKTDGPNGNMKSVQEIATELFDVHQMQVAFYYQYLFGIHS
jgi:hypothetical protein